MYGLGSHMKQYASVKCLSHKSVVVHEQFACVVGMGIIEYQVIQMKYGMDVTPPSACLIGYFCLAVACHLPRSCLAFYEEAYCDSTCPSFPKRIPCEYDGIQHHP